MAATSGVSSYRIRILMALPLSDKVSTFKLDNGSRLNAEGWNGNGNRKRAAAI